MQHFSPVGSCATNSISALLAATSALVLQPPSCLFLVFFSFSPTHQFFLTWFSWCQKRSSLASYEPPTGGRGRRVRGREMKTEFRPICSRGNVSNCSKKQKRPVTGSSCLSFPPSFFRLNIPPRCRVAEAKATCIDRLDPSFPAYHPSRSFWCSLSCPSFFPLSCHFFSVFLFQISHLDAEGVEAVRQMAREQAVSRWGKGRVLSFVVDARRVLQLFVVKVVANVSVYVERESSKISYFQTWSTPITI